jgi:adenine-specific DNA-methyltransferase
MAKCEWGHDDYSLEIKNLPKAEPAEDEPEPKPRMTVLRGSRKLRPAQSEEPSLFGAHAGKVRR